MFGLRNLGGLSTSLPLAGPLCRAKPSVLLDPYPDRPLGNICSCILSPALANIKPNWVQFWNSLRNGRTQVSRVNQPCDCPTWDCMMLCGDVADFGFSCSTPPPPPHCTKEVFHNTTLENLGSYCQHGRVRRDQRRTPRIPDLRAAGCAADDHAARRAWDG